MAGAGDVETEDPSLLQCPICLEGMKEREGVALLRRSLIKRLGCGHTFHRKCIKKSLASERSCPLCRTLVPDLSKVNQGLPQISSRVGNACCMDCREVFSRDPTTKASSSAYFRCPPCAAKLRDDDKCSIS